ncbi:hypothetical protein ADL28_03915 [Streptomyces violaceusniger]|uniref:Sulfatase-modifying factor enzyme-like domain-containing protein n=1 Tax=Streptomyces violaceusniger TaxID=68280 RepID=A0A0X3XBU2_STRVO|nr:hypothetical protein ADL28_03915 [Streptomyces violaceusniger]
MGNVWEWCAEWWATAHPRTTVDRVNPTGPCHSTVRVMRGRSYLCHACYCNRYRVAARTGNSPDCTGGDTGFRRAWALHTRCAPTVT